LSDFQIKIIPVRQKTLHKLTLGQAVGDTVKPRIDHIIDTKVKSYMTNKSENIDLSKPRRRYYSDQCDLTICPECGADLMEESCTILLCAKSDSDEGEFMTNLSGSHFCKKCPVVVFDADRLEEAAALGIEGDKNIRYIIGGIIDLDSIPYNKKHLEIGSDKNPVPLVRFLPDLNNRNLIANKNPGRNDPCLCGSGKKYKKCCGG
jgi:hypothetical protein